MNENNFLRRLPKRMLAFVLTLAMVVTLMPGMGVEVKAELSTEEAQVCEDVDAVKDALIWKFEDDGEVYEMSLNDYLTDWGDITQTFTDLINSQYEICEDFTFNEITNTWSGTNPEAGELSISVTYQDGKVKSVEYVNNNDYTGEIIYLFKMSEIITQQNFSLTKTAEGYTVTAKAVDSGDYDTYWVVWWGTVNDASVLYAPAGTTIWDLLAADLEAWTGKIVGNVFSDGTSYYAPCLGTNVSAPIIGYSYNIYDTDTLNAIYNGESELYWVGVFKVFNGTVDGKLYPDVLYSIGGTNIIPTELNQATGNIMGGGTGAPEEPEHQHDWKYSVGTGKDANKITAKCEGDGDCDVENGETTGISIVLDVDSQTYSGNPVEATLSGVSDDDAWVLAELPVPKIEYYQGDTKLPSAPKDVGSYEARITVGEDEDAVTAKAAFSIDSPYIWPVNPTTPSTPTTPEKPEAPTGGTIGDDSGNNAINIGVSTSDGNAVIADISSTTIDAVANTPATGTTLDLPPVKNDIVIDVSTKGNDGKDVTKVTITKTTAENIVEALNSSANDKENLVIITSNATVTIDAKALEAIAVQAKAETIQLVVENVQAATLNESQKAAVSALEKGAGNGNGNGNGTGNADGTGNGNGAARTVVQTFEAYFVSGGSRISDFSGGMVTVGKIDFEIPAGKNPKNYHIYYIPESGAVERYETWAEGGSLYFRTTHFSDYAIVYDEELENDSLVTVYRLFNIVNGKHLLTADRNEAEYLVGTGKWSRDNDMGKAGREGTAVYRLFNVVTGEHLYTSDVNEIKVQTAKKDWIYDNDGKPIFYGLPSGTAVYRLHNIKKPAISAHLNTSDENEINVLKGDGYVVENAGKAMFYLQ